MTENMHIDINPEGQWMEQVKQQMTENKQITIYDLLPLLKPGWVAMDPNGTWVWHQIKT